jgi:hypothetical protein
MYILKKISLQFCIVAISFSLNASDVDHSNVNTESIGAVIRHTREMYESGVDKREIAEWVTKVVDDRLINSNSREWFSRPFYAWAGVYWVRNDPSNTGEYFDQANIAWSRGYGNCGENSVVTYYILKKAGVQENLRVFQVGENRSHSFAVWNLPPTADISDPTTWEGALIVDPWLGEVLNGPDARDNWWFQNGKPETIIRDGTKDIDYEADSWQLIQKREEHRTGKKIVSKNIDNSVKDCFIASAVYGTHLNNEISILRKFRDQKLRTSILGRIFISAYERFGPMAAFYISQNESRKLWTRQNIVEPALKIAKKNQK